MSNNTPLRLDSTKRTIVGKKVAELRKKGELPAVMYGHNTEAVSISIPYGVFEKAYRTAGESSLIDLAIDGGTPHKTLIQEVTHDSLSGRFTHVDFYQVTMTEKLTASIPLVFIGEPKAVKEFGGTLMKNLDEVEVRCLPGDLIHEITVDLTSLASFDDAITLADLVLPKGVELHGEMGTIVASVLAPISEAEFNELDEKPIVDIASIEVEEKGKKEKEGE